MLKNYEPNKPTHFAAPAQDKPIMKEPTMHHEEPMTQQRREAFWRQYGWSPELPEDQRKKIEQRFTDPKIEEAEALGF